MSEHARRRQAIRDALVEAHRWGLEVLQSPNASDSPFETERADRLVLALERYGYRVVSAEQATLAVLGAMAKRFLDTTHGTELGHDHHCPGDDGCTCGWSDLQATYTELA